MSSIDAVSVTELRVQTGFFGSAGIAPLLHVLQHLTSTDRTTKFLIGSNESGTGGEDVHALASAMGLPRTRANLAICAFDNGYFHPKVVHIVRFDGSQSAYVGSANLTSPGVFGQHIEAGILLDTLDGDPAGELSRISAAIDAWFSGTRPGLFPVRKGECVDDLISSGVLAKAS